MEKKPQVGVAVLVFPDSRSEHILVGKRGKDSKRGVGLWSPPGGAMDFGERSIDAAARELKEETNLDLDIENSRVHTFTESVFEGEHWITIYVLGPVAGDLKNMEPGKCEGWEFLLAGYLRDMDLLPAFGELVARKNWFIEAILALNKGTVDSMSLLSR